MSKAKTKVKSVVVSLSAMQLSILEAMMRDDCAEDTGPYIARLIVEANKEREEKKRVSLEAKRKPGRPRKEEEEAETEEPRNIPHPDFIMNPGRMITQSELDDYNELRGVRPN